MRRVKHVSTADYFAPGKGARCCDRRVCLSLLSHISTNRVSKLHKMLPLAVTCSPCNDSAIRYVLPVSWMTSCFRITRHYGETYGRGMSVNGRQRREGRSFSA